MSGSAGDEWGSHNVDAPHVRIISMNAVDTAEGAVVMGEVVNEDTIPAFVNVNATLVDGTGQRDRRREQLRQDCSCSAAQSKFRPIASIFRTSA